MPGTNETHPGADPSQSRGLLARVTDPLRDDHPPGHLRVRYLAYPASLVLPVPYTISEAEGVGRAAAVLRLTQQTCPATQYLLVGYSQGADVVGDLAARIGHHRGPVDPTAVLGVGLLAGPHYGPAAAPTIGDSPAGVGLLGARPDGLGVLSTRTVQICAPGDPVCDPPLDAVTPPRLRKALTREEHVSYATYVVDEHGTTALEYLTNAARTLLERAGQPR